MVQVRQLPQTESGDFDTAAWIAQLPGFASGEDRARIKRACALAGEPLLEQHSDVSHQRPGYLESGLEMAAILSELQLDEESLIAAVVYPVVASGALPIDTVRSELGDEVANLLAGVLRVAALSTRDNENEPVLGQRGAQVDNLRKMLVALVDDVRVGLIKLAERTQTIRELKHAPADVQRRIAREVADVYAPLAHRLGIGHIKWELEDIAFRYLEPDDYKSIAAQLDGKRLDRDAFIRDVISQVNTALSSAGINAEVVGRAKHIYSIWKKMRRKRVAFDQVYDIRALRILVDEVRDCYACLGIVHSLWRNIPGEFDDYIANPKLNGYRSLHTAVVGPDGKVVEIQIRTHEMHREAELGLCAHWIYKGTDVDKSATGYEQKIEWLRQTLKAGESQGNIGDLAEELSEDFASDRIYVFTPKGHVVDVAAGATPVDFAYHIHTEVGHRCRGAKVDGRIVPLNTILRNGQKVEVITGNEVRPNRDWLRRDLGFLTSGRARAKVKAWFRQQARGHNIEAGKILLERDLKRMALTSVDYRILAEQLGYDAVEDLHAALGAGDLGMGQVMRVAEATFAPADKAQVSLFTTVKPSRTPRDGVSVSGVGNLVTQQAQCCKPLPGDTIVGYVTVARGVTIHREDCDKFLQISEQQPDRVIDVDWQRGVQREYSERYPVDVTIEAYDRTGLLGDITSLLAAMRVNLVNVNTYTNRDNNIAYMKLTLEIFDLAQLLRITNRLNTLPNVINVQRER
ncbi:MAG: GTP diphosphokinase [Pseudomonadales bacterium]|nr:GTP diphosphokinase [Pseudomonadales bacterium]NNM11830.1 GTP diphosphokinase [Pseudomonadales bacterium]